MLPRWIFMKSVLVVCLFLQHAFTEVSIFDITRTSQTLKTDSIEKYLGTSAIYTGVAHKIHSTKLTLHS